MNIRAMTASAERALERERDLEGISDMIRLEDEIEDVIRGADALLRDGWGDMAQVLVKVREAKAIVVNRRTIAERFTP